MPVVIRQSFLSTTDSQLKNWKKRDRPVFFFHCPVKMGGMHKRHQPFGGAKQDQTLTTERGLISCHNVHRAQKHSSARNPAFET